MKLHDAFLVLQIILQPIRAVFVELNQILSNDNYGHSL